MNDFARHDSDNNEPQNKNEKGDSQIYSATMQTKRLEAWLTFGGKSVWPFLLLLILLLFHTEVRGLFGRLTSLDVAGQKISFSEQLKEPVVNIASIYNITDVSIDIRKDTIRNDAFFQVCKKYVVLRTSEIPEEQNAQAEQMFQIIEVIRASVICGEFIGLVILDDKDRYIGSFDRNFFLETVIPWSKLVDYPANKSQSDIANWIKSNSTFGTALEFPEKRIASGEGFRFCVRQNQSVSEALEILLTSGKDFVAVVDNYGHFEGTVTRALLLNRLMLTLVPNRPPR
jgi:hypothetical protein